MVEVLCELYYHIPGCAALINREAWPHLDANFKFGILADTYKKTAFTINKPRDPIRGSDSDFESMYDVSIAALG